MKVGNIKVRIRQDEPEQSYALHYTQKDKFAVKGLPIEFLRLSGFEPSYFPTENQLITDLQEAIRKYNALKKTERKVIMFKVVASALLRMNKINQGHYEGLKRGVSENIGNLQVSNGAGIEIGFKVAIEVDQGKKEYFELDDDGLPSKYQMRFSNNEWTIIDYSLEREQFFNSITDSLQEMVYKLSQFFGGDNESVANLIDATISNNQKLLS